jgi:hypothetical protein
MNCLYRAVVVVLAAALVAPVAAGSACACPFCAMQGQPLAAEVGQATMVLYGRLTNPVGTPDGGGTTDLVVDAAIKVPRKFEGQKTVKLDRFLESPPNDKYRYLVFCDDFMGKIDPFKIVAVDKNADIGRYLQGALLQKDKKVGDRLRFFFDYLDSPDLEISNDAYKEFANAGYNDYKDMARTLPADRIARWLTVDRDKTPPYRFGLYASMLGHCGNRKHAELLRGLLDDPVHKVGSGIDGILAGYVMLEPQDGWTYTKEILGDPKKEFMVRYAALRAVRFLHDYQPVKLDKKELVGGVARLLDQGDIADLAIDDLRKWACWDMTDRVLAVTNMPQCQTQIIQRAVLRFCLSAKGMPAAERYVAEQRKKDPSRVQDVEELLKIEQQTPPVTAPGK